MSPTRWASSQTASVSVRLTSGLGVGALPPRWAAAKRYVALFRAIREHRDLAQTSLLHGAAVVLLQQFAHALLRRRVMLLQNQIGDGADDAMPRKVPCRGRHRQRACRPDGEACRSNSAFHVRIPSHVVSQLYAGRGRAAY